MSNLALIPTNEEFVLTDEIAAQVADQLTTQYRKAKAALAEVAIFGAMAAQVRDALGVCNIAHTPRKAYEKGTGFKAWLEENCPQIDRTDAYRWMSLAEGLADRFKLQSAAHIREVLSLEAPEGKDAALQRKLFSFMEDKSLSGLLAELKAGKHIVPKSAGKFHPRTEDTRTPEQRLAEAREMATTEAQEKLDGMRAWIDARNAEGSLTKATRRTLADGLRALAESVAA